MNSTTTETERARLERLRDERRAAEERLATAPSPDDIRAAEEELRRAEDRQTREAALPMMIDASQRAETAAASGITARAQTNEWIAESPIGRLIRAERDRRIAANDFAIALNQAAPGAHLLKHKHLPDAEARVHAALARVGEKTDITAVQETIAITHGHSHPAARQSVPPAALEFGPIIDFMVQLIVPSNPMMIGGPVLAEPVIETRTASDAVNAIHAAMHTSTTEVKK
jgi:hypothetical protein